MSPVRRIPSPPGHWLLGVLPQVANNETRLAAHLGFFQACGDIARIRYGPKRAILIYHPDMIKQVLQERYKRYAKGKDYDKLRGILGEGLFTSEGAMWVKQRRMMQPQFHLQRVARLAGAMTDATGEMLERWALAGVDGPLDVGTEMMKLALRIVGKTLLGVDVSDQAASVGRALTTALDHANHRIIMPVDVPAWIPTRRNREERAAIATLDQVLGRMVAMRREAGGEPGDLLAMLLEARDEETGEAMSDRQLRDEAITIFLAGYETSAHGLAWTLHLLAEHPAWQDRVVEELDEVLGGRAPTFEDLGRLKTLGMVIDEALRLFPPLWILIRRAIEVDELGGYTIPVGTEITLNPYVTHRHPVYWQDPERFDPLRFTPEAVAARHRYAYFPFGGGARQCIGSQFALMEMKLVLAMVLAAFRVSASADHPVHPEPMVTLRPRGGLTLEVSPRRSTASSSATA